MKLCDLIIERIKNQGAISFRDYMEMALYHKDHGYFTGSGNVIGRRGDFFTSPYISSAFGAMLAKQIEEIRRFTGEEFTIVEYGAGAGLLSRDILDYLQLNSKTFQAVRYVIVERSPALRKISQHFLGNRVTWIDDISELGTINGCIISNEMFDNFPVHRIIWKEKQPMEIFVAYQNGFKEILKPAAKDILKSIPYSHTELPEAFQTEVCMDAIGWFNNISRILNRGYIITIDYGYLFDELLQQEKLQGSIRCFYKHEVYHDPYERPGEQDITADVNFSSLCYWGSKAGFELAGYVSQNQFLRALGFIPYVSNLNDSNENKLFAYDTLLNQMGSRFKVMIQQKNVPVTPLTGLAFQKPQEKRMCEADRRYQPLVFY